MRVHFRWVVVVAALAALPAQAKQIWIGRLTSTGSSVNNSTTAVPFTIPGTPGFGVKISVQCQDGAAWYRSGSGSSLTVSVPPGSTAGVYLGMQQLLDDPLTTSDNAVAVISASGTVNCDVYFVTP